ncbi:hypothetical protein VSO92_03240 [Myroides pelagicus]|uniref:hypothetical protein n=1 Tax=Myroides pelagicus TaxID=270914 RepID=UPI002DBB993A|nr:hypothetical protein [Myroides pelagicus]MEC4113119.1 hypothetical protein [Myroides pelagicus]
MRQIFFILWLMMSSGVLAQSESLSEQTREQVSSLIHLFQSNDQVGISLRISYPFDRPYPISRIDNFEEFVVRFDQVFDEAMVAEIGNSTLEDWSTVGWRGTMYKSGDLWMTEDGFIKVVNRHTEAMDHWQKQLIEKDRQRLHSSVQRYEFPLAIIRTSSHYLRIDALADQTYRLVYWTINQSMSESPVEIVEQGKMFVEGSMANRYVFFPMNKEGEEVTIYLDYLESTVLDEVQISYLSPMGLERVDRGYLMK